MNTIIFGSRRLGVSDIPTTNEKYPGVAIVTVEPQKDGGKSRRVLFNKTAAELIGLEEGVVNNVVFGTCIGADGKHQVLVANADSIDSDDLTTYKTSKNRVSFDGTKEKGKAISSSTISREISAFLGLSDDTLNEFQLNTFDTEGIESFSMDLYSGVEDDVVVEEVSVESTDADVDFEEFVADDSVVIEEGLPQRVAVGTFEDEQAHQAHQEFVTADEEWAN